MNIPFYQRLFRWVVWIFGGILALGGLLDSFGNAVSLITPRVATTFSVIFLCFWGITEFVIWKHPVHWRGVDGSSQRITRIGAHPRLALLGVFILLWVPQLLPKPPVSEPYPWISLNGGWISVEVRDFPTKQNPKRILSHSTLYNVTLSVTTPIAINPTTDAWHSCIVAQYNVLELNNSNQRHLVAVPSDRDIVPLEMRMGARNGSWSGAAIFRRNVTYVESLSGMFTSNPLLDKMRVRETRETGMTTLVDGEPAIEFTREQLIALGLPIIQFTKEELEAKCPKGHIFTGKIVNGKMRQFKP